MNSSPTGPAQLGWSSGRAKRPPDVQQIRYVYALRSSIELAGKFGSSPTILRSGTISSILATGDSVRFVKALSFFLPSVPAATAAAFLREGSARSVRAAPAVRPKRSGGVPCNGTCGVKPPKVRGTKKEGRACAGWKLKRKNDGDYRNQNGLLRIAYRAAM
jgi:hypothetical protein